MEKWKPEVEWKSLERFPCGDGGRDTGDALNQPEASWNAWAFQGWKDFFS